MRQRAIAAFFALLMMVSAPDRTAGAERHVLTDTALNIRLTLPEGFEPVSNDALPSTLASTYVYRRGDPGGEQAIVLIIEPLDGVLPHDPDNSKPAEIPGVERTYREAWKTFQLQVLVYRNAALGEKAVLRTVTVPIRPRALRITAVGFEPHDRKAAHALRDVLIRLDGPTNWTVPLSPRERGEALADGLIRMLAVLAGITAIPYVLCAWRGRAFRNKATAAGLDPADASQKIRPKWVGYLPGVYTGYAGLIVFLWMTLRNLRRGDFFIPGESWTALALGLAVLAGVTAFVMHRRGRAKRQILSTRPPLPTASSATGDEGGQPPPPPGTDGLSR